VGTVTLARVYDPDDGRGTPRFLVERLWPRGIRRDALRLTGWLPDVAPSTGLRKWFDHRPERWEVFRQRYRAELEAHPETWRVLRDAAAEGDVVLLYSSRDVEHNSAVALRAFLTGPAQVDQATSAGDQP
jgi:uncharacterized protein YeaO (DUF488 family)